MSTNKITGSNYLLDVDIEGSDVLVIVDASWFSQEILASIVNLSHRARSLQVASFSRYGISQLRAAMGSSMVPAVYVQDLLSSDQLEEIDDYAYRIIRGWYCWDEVKEKASFEYQGITLGPLSVFELSLSFPQLLKRIKLLKLFLESMTTQHVVIFSDDERWTAIGEGVRSSLGFEDVRFHQNKTNEFGSDGDGATDTYLKSSLQRCLSGVNWIYQRAAASWNRKHVSVPRILMKNPNEFALTAFDTESLMVLDTTFSRSGIEHFKKGRRYFTFEACPITSGAQYRQKEASDALSRIWQELNDNSSRFANRFVYEDVRWWNIAKGELAKYFDLIDQYIRWIDAAHHVVELAKPDLILSIPGVTAEEKILFQTGRKLGIPSSVLQHGITNDRRAQEVLYADHAFIWGKGQQDWYVRHGNVDSSYHIVGNPEFDNLAHRERFLKREALCAQLQLDTEHQIVTFASSQTLKDAPFFSASRVSDEGISSIWMLLEVMKEIDNIALVVKLHPRETASPYFKIVENYPEFKDRVKIVTHTDLHSLLYHSLAVVASGSTIVLEAMILKRPVIVLNMSHRDLAVTLVKSGAVLGATNFEELKRVILMILGRNKVNVEETKEFVSDYAGPFDMRSVERFRSGVLDIARSVRGAFL